MNLKNNAGEIPLHAAAEGDNERTVELLLNKTLDVNSKDKYGRSPLHLASSVGHENIMELLINAGADVNLKNNFSYTPLLIAAGKGFYLLELKFFFTFFLFKRCDCGLFLSGRAKPIELLVNKGADVHVRSRDGWTPLYTVAGYGNGQIHGSI